MDEKEMIPQENPQIPEEEEAIVQAESTPEEIAAKNKKKRTLTQDFFDYIIDILVTSVVVAIFMLSLVVRTGYVDGESMAPTMLDGDRYLVSGLFYTPKQGDVIVFQPLDNDVTRRYIHGENKLLVKRVIATEGQVVDIDEDTHKVIVDGVVLSEPYIKGDITYKRLDSTIKYPYEVPAGHVFVLGDNRPVSVDSRQLGSIDIRTILGKVIVRFFPFDKIGAVN